MDALKIPSIIICLCVLLLAGCTFGSASVTGEPRTPLDPSQVQIFTHSPPYYDVIGIVSASTDLGLTDQSSIDIAVQELKKQAAKLGANGIILAGKPWIRRGDVLVGVWPTPIIHGGITTIKVWGKAIYVCYDPNLNDTCKAQYIRASINSKLGLLDYAEYVISRDGDMTATYRLLEEGVTSEYSEVQEKYRLFVAQNPEILEGARSTFTPESFKESIIQNGKNANEIENRRLLIYKTVAPSEDYLKARQNFESVFGFAE